ncbi:MAG: hypothetical protein GX793_08980 [Bacteroidales bacterium]|nr:hypothetical protein [Bacteroidales bacterium]
MKLRILKQTIKEGISKRTGNEYKIASRFVSFEDTEIYQKIVSHLKSKGIDDEQIEKFCRPNEYEGKVSYAFGLNCSNYTFEKVDQFGILDAAVIFNISDNGFISARIPIKNRREQVNSYEPPADMVEGWTSEPEIVEKEKKQDPFFDAKFDDNPEDDLPF